MSVATAKLLSSRQEPLVVRTRDELAAARAGLPGTAASVFTMGALHEGHLANMRLAREHADHVLVSIFVNPLQFGAGEDLDRYPRSFDADLAGCAEAGVDVVFAPDVAAMYPDGAPQIGLDPGPLGQQLEGASRLGHFAGMLTVVAKLLGLTDCAVSVFGEKDYQQLVLVRRMVSDLEIGTRIVGAPIVREPDGLAMSSRNRYLTAEQHAAALALSGALRAGSAAGSADGVLAAASRVLADEPGVAVDYLELRAPDLGPAPRRGPARLLVAARVGATRLIDNIAIELP